MGRVTETTIAGSLARMSGPPPHPNSGPLAATVSFPWSIRHWAAIWAAGTVGGIFLALIASLMWNGDVLSAEFAFFVALPAQSVAQAIALAVGLKKLGAGLETDLGFDIRLADLRVAPLAVLNLVALSFALNPILEAFDITEQSQGELELFASASQSALFVGVLVAVGFAPIYEELLFRGMLQRALAARLGRVSTMVATASMFGLAHLVTLDPGLDQWPIHAALVVVSIGWLGFILSWLADRDGRLGRAIVFHSTHNLVVIAATLVAASDVLTV